MGNLGGNMGNSVIVKPYTNSRYVDWDSETEVRRAWNQGLDFYTPYEKNSCMNKRNWIKYGNKLDTVIYMFNGLTVTLAGLGVE